ncbi:MAG: nitroreductase family protein [Candidatus Acidiferrum sp.]
MQQEATQELIERERQQLLFVVILAARALGLDCGPMSGFDADKLNAAFFPDGKWKVNLICNLGYGDPSKLHRRNPRLNFEEAAVIL